MARIVLFLFFLCAGMVSTYGARAQEFTKPTHDNLIKTLIRYGAVNINADEIIDDYALLTECKIYQYFYKDDFRWQDVRNAFRKKIRRDVGVYPTGYYYDTELQLDRYDFKEKLYRFRDEATIKNVNAFVIFDTPNISCGRETSRNLPHAFKVVLRKSLYIPGLPLSREDANALLKRMNESGNRDRIIPARFNMRIVYVSPFVKGPKEEGYKQDVPGISPGTAVFDGRLISVDFFEDSERTKLIYSYQETE